MGKGAKCGLDSGFDLVALWLRGELHPKRVMKTKVTPLCVAPPSSGFMHLFIGLLTESARGPGAGDAEVSIKYYPAFKELALQGRRGRGTYASTLEVPG